MIDVAISTFKYTSKQKKLFNTLKNKDKRIFLVDGGSRSGKTVGIARWFIVRCITYPNTRRVVVRQSKASAKRSVWLQTIIPMLESYFEGLYTYDRTNNIINFHNGSSIWLGGFDNKQHTDDVLGQEWADIWINEGTDIKYELFGKLKTRLNIDSRYAIYHNFQSKFIIDCNPKGTAHWLNKFFIKGIDPDLNKKAESVLLEDIDRCWFHPLDNRVNLDPKTILTLERLSGQNKKRFWEGIWADQVENSIYRFDRKVNVIDFNYRYERGVETWCSLDFGTKDPTFIIWYQIVQVPLSVDNELGILIYIFDEYSNTDKDVRHYAELIQAKSYYDTTYAGDPSGINRAVGLDSWIGKFSEFGIDIQINTKHTRAEKIDNANDYMKYVRINEDQCPLTLEMFENWEYALDKDDRPIEGTPNHDIFSHPGTSFYFFTTVRYPMIKPSEIMIH